MFYGLKHGELPARIATNDVNQLLVPLEKSPKIPEKRGLKKEIVLSIESDSEASYTFLYKRFYKPITRYIRRKIKNPEVVEEIAQEIFLKVHRFQDTYKEEHAFSTWLWTIAKNTVYDYLRAIKASGNFKSEHSNEKNQDPDELPSLQINAENLLICRDQRRHLIKVFKLLTRPQKRVIWMRVIHHLSYDDISKQLQLSLTSVKNLAYRAKITLAENLDPSRSSC